MKKTERLPWRRNKTSARGINHFIIIYSVRIDVEIHRAGDRYAVTPANGSGAVFERFHLVINLCRRYERILMAANDHAPRRGANISHDLWPGSVMVVRKGSC